MNLDKFKESITQGIPSILPPLKTPSDGVPHAPVRKEILTSAEKELALSNALRYFPEAQHAVLAPEFAQELKNYGRIYMYRLMPDVEIKARPIEWYPAKCQQAASIMLMIQNNLDAAVAQQQQQGGGTSTGRGGGATRAPSRVRGTAPATIQPPAALRPPASSLSSAAHGMRSRRASIKTPCRRKCCAKS